MFLNPLLLLTGVAALAVPVYVHLQMRRRRVRVVFSSLRLVEESQRVALRRRRITNWPVFLLRCLAVLLLAFVFGRPLLDAFRDPVSGRKETVAFVLDLSASMYATGEAGPVWDEATAAVREELRRSNRASRIALLTTPRHTDETEIRWQSPGRTGQELDNLTPGYGRADLPLALGRAASALARTEDEFPKVLHLVSDLQTDAIKDLDRVELPPNVAIRVTKVGDLEPSNSGLMGGVRGTDELRRGVYALQTTEAVTTASNVEVVERDQNNQAIGERTELISSGIESGVSRRYSGVDRGWYSRTLTLTGEDALAVDDQLYDSFYVQSRVQVLLVEPRIEAETFNQATFFFSRALDPFLGEEDATKKATRFVPEVVPVKSAAERVVELPRRTSVVFLPATSRVSKQLGEALTAFVGAGGGLILFNGTDATPWLYQLYFSQLLPVNIGDAEGIEGRVTVEIVTDSHPLWGGLDEQSRRQMSRLPLFKRSKINGTNDSLTLARYSDGVPLVVQKTMGEGRVLFVNTSADRQWGDWQTKGGLFVPTIHVLASQALANREGTLRNASVQLTVDSSSGFDVGRAYAGRTVRIGDEQFNVDGQGMVVDTSPNKPGLYVVEAEDGSIVRQFAANVPPEESDLDSVQGVVIRRQLEAQRLKVGDEAALVARPSESNSAVWKALLVVLTFLLAVEPLVANRF